MIHGMIKKNYDFFLNLPYGRYDRYENIDR